MDMKLIELAKRAAKTIGPIKRLVDSRERIAGELAKTLAECDRVRNERDQLQDEIKELAEFIKDRAQAFDDAPLFVPAGHFYSPIPSRAEIERDASRIFDRIPQVIPDVDLNESGQLVTLKKISEYYEDLPFRPNRVEGLRYFYENPAFSYSDAIFLIGMIRLARPSKVIEVGSGYSSCVIMDVNDLWFDGAISCVFVEPYPELLLSLLKPGDLGRISIHQSRLQDVDLSLFASLKEGDILFVDSTHVAKTGSDVNYLFFDVLPVINSGVYIHFHDVFFPFEYPRTWIEEGRAWNELYMLRAFLECNDRYQIVAFNTYLAQAQKDFLQTHMPLCLKNPGGSIWLQKR